MLNVMICYVSKRCKMYCCMCLSNFCYFFFLGRDTIYFLVPSLLSLFSSDLSCRVSKMDFTSVSQNLIKNANPFSTNHNLHKKFTRLLSNYYC